MRRRSIFRSRNLAILAVVAALLAVFLTKGLHGDVDNPSRGPLDNSFHITAEDSKFCNPAAAAQAFGGGPTRDPHPADFNDRVTAALDALEPAVPDNPEIKEPMTYIINTLREVTRTNNPAPLLTDDFDEANDQADQYILEHCGATEVNVVARDMEHQHSFDVNPPEAKTQVNTGLVLFIFTNDGSQPHELQLMRDGDATPVTWVAADPGGSDMVIANLPPGHYTALCNIPEDDNQTHADLGMKYGFEVN